MKTIGLLGGMSWESTVGYYQAINQGIKAQLGGLHSAQIAMRSVDFAQIEALQKNNDWASAAKILAAAAQQIEAAGAHCLLICTNTMHKVADEIQAVIDIPLIHIADATGDIILQHQLTSVGLLGTRYTMEQAFYKQRLIDNYAIDVVVPEPQAREEVNQIIFDELCLGQIKLASKEKYLTIIDQLTKQGAQAVILGCTEIGMLVKPEDTNTLLLDTTAIHAAKAVAFALAPT